jgi:O-antigen/teichoic acid export membrane protein
VSPLVFKLASPIAFKLIFPNFGEESRKLLHIVIWAIPFTTLISLMRPFVMKFAAIKITPLINALSLLGTLVPAIVLIPSLHASGAAWAVVVGQAVTGSLWTIFALRLFWIAR